MACRRAQWLKREMLALSRSRCDDCYQSTWTSALTVASLLADID
eukprot:CAMPEP_0179361478 /NCGR_PEP_ID=MMETSP0797-20121207/80520_1 /TAXON_ID=47934 /ORGANISM="Dinophysis acuminata, Strain DAEP01" /LENGTH=43 /DNA_ID= /DNA_START= /DNA_END= /DNA_ORIENTATION=